VILLPIDERAIDAKHGVGYCLTKVNNVVWVIISLSSNKERISPILIKASDNYASPQRRKSTQVLVEQIVYVTMV
jgi:hypothetical protein